MELRRRISQGHTEIKNDSVRQQRVAEFVQSLNSMKHTPMLKKLKHEMLTQNNVDSEIINLDLERKSNIK